MSAPAHLLLFPAMAQDSHSYDLVGLSGSRTYVYPGHGGTEPRLLSLDALADEAMSPETQPVDLIGVALGGIVAQHALARHGSAVRSAVLANTPGGVSDRGPLIARADETRAHGPHADELLARWLRPATVAAGGPAVDYLRQAIAAVTRDGLANIQQAMADHDLLETLAGDEHPVTFVVGEDDHVGVGATERLAEAFPNKRMRRIPGGHMVHLDNPEGFREVVLEHLTWVDSLETQRKEAASA